tara:strand:- start:2708 stop:4309 length:1602 start_codon:yes stop_codon:yes gene_type:complete
MALFDDLLGKAKKNPLMAAGLASLPVAPVFGVSVLAVDDILKKKQREKDAYNRALTNQIAGQIATQKMIPYLTNENLVRGQIGGRDVDLDTTALQNLAPATTRQNRFEPTGMYQLKDPIEGRPIGQPITQEQFQTYSPELRDQFEPTAEMVTIPEEERQTRKLVVQDPLTTSQRLQSAMELLATTPEGAKQVRDTFLNKDIDWNKPLFFTDRESLKRQFDEIAPAMNTFVEGQGSKLSKNFAGQMAANILAEKTGLEKETGMQWDWIDGSLGVRPMIGSGKDWDRGKDIIKNTDFKTKANDFREQRLAVSTMNDLAKKGASGSDIALIFSFFKALDPGSRVTDSEVRLGQLSGGRQEEVKQILQAWAKNQVLTPTQRKTLVEAGLQVVQSSYNDYRTSYEDTNELLMRNNLTGLDKHEPSSFEDYETGLEALTQDILGAEYETQPLKSNNKDLVQVGRQFVRKDFMNQILVNNLNDKDLKKLGLDLTEEELLAGGIKEGNTFIPLSDERMKPYYEWASKTSLYKSMNRFGAEK